MSLSLSLYIWLRRRNLPTRHFERGPEREIEREEEEVIYIRPRLQVRITGPRRLLPRCEAACSEKLQG
jgi:hypothetical protein